MDFYDGFPIRYWMVVQEVRGFLRSARMVRARHLDAIIPVRSLRYVISSGKICASEGDYRQALSELVYGRWHVGESSKSESVL